MKGCIIKKLQIYLYKPQQITIQNQKKLLNSININRLELENRVKCIYIDKNKNVKIDFK